jgi:hypothetical protein
MALKKFKKQPKEKRQPKPPFVRIMANGVITFNKGLSRFLNLSEGIGIDFYQDEEDSRDWYLKVDKDSENKVRKKKPHDLYVFNNVRLANAILSSIGASDEGLDTLALPVVKEATTFPESEGNYFAIITNVIRKND